jgi:hypothetical protein
MTCIIQIAVAQSEGAIYGSEDCINGTASKAGGRSMCSNKHDTG